MGASGSGLRVLWGGCGGGPCFLENLLEGSLIAGGGVGLAECAGLVDLGPEGGGGLVG